MTAQAEFDAKYITSLEVCRELGITRAVLRPAIDRGTMPAPVEIPRPSGQIHVLLWVRDEARPYIDRWRQELATRRGVAA